MPTAQEGLLVRLGAIGDRPGDDEGTRLKHRLLVYMGSLMSGGGLLWGGLCAAHGLFWPSAVPLGYTALTVVNFAFFAITKDFVKVRFVQVLLSLLLPFLFQWCLGGFGSSGAVMLWSMLSIVGSLTFSEARSSLKWLAVYTGLTILSGLLDATVKARFDIAPSASTQTLFFAVNVVVISNIVFGLTIYLLHQRETTNLALAEANRKITLLNERLEDEVAARTQEVRASLAQTRAILDNLADGLFAASATGEVTAVNPALFALLGLPRGQAVQTGAMPEDLTRLCTRSIQQNEVVHAEVPLPGDRIGAAVASPIHGDEAGKPGGAVVIVRDVTLEKEVDRMKTDFTATVSHELRTPLTSVLGFAKVTRNKLDGVLLPLIPLGDGKDKKIERAIEQVRGNLDVIVSEGERLTALINDVLDISKMEAGRMEWKRDPVDVRRLVERALEATRGLFASGKVAIRHTLDEQLGELVGDHDRLMQVLINLVSNAAKFTGQGEVHVVARAHGPYVEVSVTDTGPGIDPSEHEAIFQKFKQGGDTLTAKPQGTGLGLPICRQIVTAHHGTIHVESRLGAGATFTVRLPRSEATTSGSMTVRGPITVRTRTLAAKVLEQVEHGALGAGRVLVVDDDANFRELLRQQLGERGYDVEQVADGYEAIEVVRQRPPHVIILDVLMPGISGLDVAAVLKTDPNTAQIPILVLSIVHDAARGHRLGVEKYLPKPVDAEVLAAEIQTLMHEAHLRQTAATAEEEVPA